MGKTSTRCQRKTDSLKILLLPKSTKQHDYTARHIFVKSFLKKCLCPFDQQPVLAAIYRRSGVGARIAFAAGKLRRSYSLTFLHCSALARQFSSPRLCTAWNTTRSYLITAKPAPPMAWQGLYISSGSLTLRRNVGRFPAGSAQTSFSSFADTSNNSLCGWLMKILLV